MYTKYIDCIFIRNKNVVAFTINYMDARLLGIDFTSSNGLKVCSKSCPELACDCIFLRGDTEETDYDIVKIVFDTEEEAKKYVEKAEQAIHEACDFADKNLTKKELETNIYLTRIKR